jgi:thioredoxin 1
MSAGIKHVSDASFEQDVLKSDKPVLLDFWAEWCGPCKMIGPILEELSQEYGDKLQIAKMNVDENQGVPAQFNIRGIPTLILFKNGAVAAQKVGALAKSQNPSPGKSALQASNTGAHWLALHPGAVHESTRFLPTRHRGCQESLAKGQRRPTRH